MIRATLKAGTLPRRQKMGPNVKTQNAEFRHAPSKDKDNNVKSNITIVQTPLGTIAFLFPSFVQSSIRQFIDLSFCCEKKKGFTLSHKH